MFHTFGSLKSLLKVPRVSTSGLVFKLHYRATVAVLLTSCLLVAARQYVGDPINCMHDKDLSHNAVNTLCWIQSTFSIRSAFHKIVGVDVSHPGIENSLGGQKPKKEHRYYQWVVFCLFAQVSVVQKTRTIISSCCLWLWTWLLTLRLFNGALLPSDITPFALYDCM
jgi:hypothetical protein